MLQRFKIKLIDKYIIGNYLTTFFFSLLICTLIACSIDFSDKVQSFIEKPCTKLEIASYYLGFMLHMSGLLMPLYTLIAVVFFTSRMATNAEILAILNAGVSFWRLMRPYILAASCVALMHLFFNHYAIPKMNKSRLWFERTYVWLDQEKSRSSNVHFMLGPTTKAFVRGYNKTSKTISSLKLEKFTGSRIESILEAENATYKDSTQRWILSNYTIRKFDGLHESITRPQGILDTAISLSPSDFTFFNNKNEELTTSELNETIQRDKKRGLAGAKTYELERQRRTAEPFTNFILTIIGLSVAGRKVRGGMGLHLAIAIGIGALYILLSKFAVSFAASGSVPVVVGMWIPNMLFMSVALFLMFRAQK
jgi:lipopolysaccharide export system permease protein